MSDDDDAIDTPEALFDQIDAANPGLDERQLREFCVKWTAARQAIRAVRTAGRALTREHLEQASAAMQEAQRFLKVIELDPGDSRPQ